MTAWLDWLWPRLAVTATLALLLSGLFALLLVGLRQPARRVWLARVAILWLLLVPAGMLLREPSWRAGLAAVPLWGLGETALGIPSTGRRALAAAYLGGAGFALGWLALGGLALRRAVRRAHPAGHALQALLDEMSGSPDIHPGIRVRISRDLSQPLAAGLFRPVLLLPTALVDAAPADDRPLRLALAHELAHCRRGDLPFSTMGQLASALWFFLPPVRWIERQMRRDQEFLADREAADRLGGGPLPYASALLGLASGDAPARHPSPDGPGNGPATAAHGGLLARMAMLLRSPFPVESRAPWWYRGGSLVACGLGAILAMTGPPPTRPSSTGTRAAPGVSQFAVSSLVLERPAAGHPGADLHTVLPVPTPLAFHLEFEVDMAMRDRLDVELAGARLVVRPQKAQEVPSGLPHWTRLRLTRHLDQDWAWVDGVPVALSRAEGPPSGMFVLRFRDVEHLDVRNLTLSW